MDVLNILELLPLDVLYLIIVQLFKTSQKHTIILSRNFQPARKIFTEMMMDNITYEQDRHIIFHNNQKDLLDMQYLQRAYKKISIKVYFTQNNSRVKNMDISLFNNVNSINIEDYYITDLSSLTNIKEIYLFECKNVSDISMFSKISTCSLISCNNIVDISPLKDVKNLTILYCSNVTDFSSLGNQDYLSISSNALTDVSNFYRIKNVNLGWCNHITDFSPLGNVEKLSINYCNCITTATGLGNVPELSITSCKNLIDISSLGNHISLNLYDCPGITNVSNLKNVSTLIIAKTNITDISGLTNVDRLDITWCKNINISTLPKKTAVRTVGTGLKYVYIKDI